jgi:hypothetical protein
MLPIFSSKEKSIILQKHITEMLLQEQLRHRKINVASVTQLFSFLPE